MKRTKREEKCNGFKKAVKFHCFILIYLADFLLFSNNYPARACTSRGLCDLGWCPYTVYVYNKNHLLVNEKRRCRDG